MRLEYYTPLKKALFCSLKVHTLKKFATTLCVANIFLATLHVAQHGLYTSNLLPTPMQCDCIARADVYAYLLAWTNHLPQISNDGIQIFYEVECCVCGHVPAKRVHERRLLPDCSIGMKETAKIKAHIATCKLNYTMMDCEGRLFSHRHAQIGAMQIFSS